MKYLPRSIEFFSLDGGDFNIHLEVSTGDAIPQHKGVDVKASELQGMDFISVVSLFRSRINEAFIK